MTTTRNIREVNQRRLQRARDNWRRQADQFNNWCVRHGDWDAIDAFDAANDRIRDMYIEYYDMDRIGVHIMGGMELRHRSRLWVTG